MANRTKRTPKKIQQFLERLGECGNLSRAAKELGLGRQTIYEWRDDSPEFNQAVEAAFVKYAEDILEVEADRRAVQGVHHKSYFDKEGNWIGEERRYSDTLLIFRLKSLKPEAYRENTSADIHLKGKIEHSVSLDQRLAQAHEQLEQRRNGHRTEAEPIG